MGPLAFREAAELSAFIEGFACVCILIVTAPPPHQVARAEARFEAANARAVADKKGAVRQERGAKPEDLLRLHEVGRSAGSAAVRRTALECLCVQTKQSRICTWLT